MVTLMPFDCSVCLLSAFYLLSVCLLSAFCLAANGKVIKDVNGKSANLNNCLQNVIYSSYRMTTAVQAEGIDSTESVVAQSAAVTTAAAAENQVSKESKGKPSVEWDLQAIPLHEMFVILDADQVRCVHQGGKSRRVFGHKAVQLVSTVLAAPCIGCSQECTRSSLLQCNTSRSFDANRSSYSISCKQGHE